MTGIQRESEGRFDTEIQGEARRRWRQRQELCKYKSKNAKDCIRKEVRDS